MTGPAFRTGSSAAEKAAPKGGGGDYDFFIMKEGDEGMVLRYLTDADSWITVDQHWSETREKHPDWPQGSKWPRGMSVVCRNDEAFRGMDGFGDCYICEFGTDDEGKPNKASPRTWALAALREEIKEDGRVVGVQDVMIDGPDGEPVPQIVIVNQAYSNFFANLQAFAGRYTTVLDRDYYVERTGGNKTNYPHVPLDPVTLEFEDGETMPLDLRDEGLLEYYIAGRKDLGEVVMDKASEHFYALFFDERVPHPPIGKKGDKSKGKDGEASAEATEPAPKQDAAPAKPDADRLASIRARVSQKG